MVRRRTAVSIAVAGLLLAAPALTACGSGPAHPGAAAVIGDHRITESTLQARVDALRTEEGKSPQGEQALASSGNLSAQTLSMLVQYEVIARATSDAGLHVSDADVQREHAAALAQFGGSEAQLDAVLLQNYGVAPSGADEFFRSNVAVGKLIQSLGFQPGSDGGNQALVASLSKTANSLGVHINPRYGTWDGKKAAIAATSDPWVAKKTVIPEPDAGA
ncbi:MULTISPECIES: SurA N-terminal domain-containing protein [unclassified Streptomyces]|uniref:SurA N-terminal domain-containing protein n=1 Tax=unclassified Streptomyces TaxID=2593676 RepID=UPI002E2C3BF4|nr:SurA N-terminal domain-containing protein [Streptomyces sp. NBC_00223]